eukprot:1434651-Amphidinium_carterae.2
MAAGLAMQVCHLGGNPALNLSDWSGMLTSAWHSCTHPSRSRSDAFSVVLSNCLLGTSKQH